MSGDDGSVTGAPSHHQVAAIASAVSASATRADPIVSWLGIRDTPLPLTLKPGAAKMHAQKGDRRVLVHAGQTAGVGVLSYRGVCDGGRGRRPSGPRPNIRSDRPLETSRPEIHRRRLPQKFRSNVPLPGRSRPNKSSRSMLHRAFSVIGGLCAALWLASRPPRFSPGQPIPSLPTSSPRQPARKPRKRRRRSTSSRKPSTRSADRPAIPNASGSAAGWSACLWRDDLDTAFRHLDLYDRFGCPGGHIQATLPLPDPARQQHRSEGRRQPEWAGPGLLDQPDLAGLPAPAAAAAAPRPPVTDHDPLTRAARKVDQKLRRNLLRRRSLS